MSSAAQSHTIFFDEFCVDLLEHVLYRNEERIRLTPKEFDTLRVLAENRGHVVAKEEIMKEVWRDTFIGDSSLTRNISVLRKVLGPDVIETIPKRGYLFVARTEESTEGRPRGETELVKLSEPRYHSSAVRSMEGPNLKGIALSALVLLIEAVFTKK